MMDEFSAEQGEDVVEQGDDHPLGRLASLIAHRPGWLGWRPSRGAAIAAAIALVAGLAAGYQTGRSAGESRAAAQAASTPPGGPSPAFVAGPAVPYNPRAVRRIQAPPAPGAPALTQAPGACSAQAGKDLQLGIQVANVMSGQVTLRRVVPDVYGGALKMVSQQWEPCGGLPTGYPDTGDIVGPGSTSWFSVTFRVLVTCPRPYPVMFTVEYEYGGHTATVHLPGFPDLGQVPYSGCRRGS